MKATPTALIDTSIYISLTDELSVTQPPFMSQPLFALLKQLRLIFLLLFLPVPLYYVLPTVLGPHHGPGNLAA